MTARRWAILGTATLTLGLLAACDGSTTSPSTPPSTSPVRTATTQAPATPSAATSPATGPSPSASDLVETLPAPVPTGKAPSVVGQPLDKARAKLQEMGYVVTAEDPIHYRAVSVDSEWQVIEQSQSGSTVKLGVQKYTDVPDGGTDPTDKD